MFLWVGVGQPSVYWTKPKHHFVQPVNPPGILFMDNWMIRSMKLIRSCPKCRSEKLKRFSFRIDPATGKKVARPATLPTTLMVAIPWGMLCIYMIFNSGVTSGDGIWLLGLISALVGSLYVRSQNRYFSVLTPEYEDECQRCHFRWGESLE